MPAEIDHEFRTRPMDCSPLTDWSGDWRCECCGWQRDSDATFCRETPDTIIVMDGDEGTHVHIHHDHVEQAKRRMLSWVEDLT